MSIIRLIYILSPLFALLAGVPSYKYLDRKLKLLLIYTIVGFCTEILNWLLLKMGLRNNTPGLHFYIMFEVLIWAIFYAEILEGFVQKKYIFTIVILFEVFCIINFLFIQDLKTYPHTRTIEDLLMISFAILFYTKTMLDAKIKNLLKSPLIWINTSVLLYFAGNFFYNIVFVNALLFNQIFLKTTALYIFGLFNFLYYCGIAAGFILQKKNQVIN